MKHLAGFTNVFGPNHNLGVVAVRIASVSAVSVWIKVSWIRLDDALNPGLVQKALGCLSIRS